MFSIGKAEEQPGWVVVVVFFRLNIFRHSLFRQGMGGYEMRKLSKHTLYPRYLGCGYYHLNGLK
jgi:hypothetical protein